MNQTYNTDKMYRLPWTKEDNPTGWIEVTTFCQLKCPGCYRGLAENNPDRIHEDVGKIKKEIDDFIEKRNIQTLSIAGGEPLLYPRIKEIISYANSKQLKTRIFTNGLALSKERLERLKSIGATEFVIHIDKFQDRFDLKNKLNTNELRQKYCDIFREVGDVNLGFILPVSRNNFEEMNSLLELAKENSDVVNLIVFTPYKDVVPIKNNTYNKNKVESISFEDVADTIFSVYKTPPNSFLGKITDKYKPSWMFFMPVFYGNKIVGHIDSLIYKKIQDRYYKKNNRYMVTSKGNKINLKSLMPLAFNKNIARILFNISKEKEKEVLRYQTILIIDAPEKINGVWELCDGCPDAMYFNEKLVPSCLLERVKKGEEILIS